MINATAAGVEVLVWHYAIGKPVERVETSMTSSFVDVTNEELRDRVLRALSTLHDRTR
jgi:hypothetical protein